jgi:hypothetical protein
METWLSRSGDCPLSLILSDFPAQDLLLRQFLHIAVPHCQRWEHVELTVPFKHLFLIQGEMPLLSYLKLDLSQFTGHDGSPTLRLFDRAPQLKRLSLPRCGSALWHRPTERIRIAGSIRRTLVA